MASSNPIFNNSAVFNPGNQKALDRLNAQQQTDGLSAEQLNELYSMPSATPAETDRMSYDDVIIKTLSIFGLLLVGAAVGWFMPALLWPGAIAGFVLAMVNIFKKKPSAGLILGYGLAEGLFLGALTGMMESIFPGIAIQALLGTLSVFGVTLVLFANGKIRASAKATKIFMIALIGYAVFSLINVGLMLFGVTTDPWGLRTGVEIMGIPLGLILGVVAVLLAAYSLVLDFDSIQQGVRQGAPRVFGWKAAFGLTVTLIWLYVEILRIIAIFRGD